MTEIVKFAAYSGYSPSVKKVVIERETASCVWIRGRRYLKSSDYERHFDSFDEAKAFIVGAAIYERDKAVAHLKAMEERLADARDIKDAP